MLSGTIKDRVLREDLHLKYEEDLVAEVLRLLPKRPENTLQKKRTRHLGPLPSSNLDFDPRPTISQCKGGDHVLLEQGEGG